MKKKETIKTGCRREAFEGANNKMAYVGDSSVGALHPFNRAGYRGDRAQR